MERRDYDNSRAARRRALNQRRRRRWWIGGAVAVVAGAALVYGIVLLADRSLAERASGSPAPHSTVASLASPAPSSPFPSPAPSPSPAPAKPPLDKPTRKHPLRVYFGGDSLAGAPGILFAQRGAKSGLMRVRTDYQVSSRLTNTDPVDWPARLKTQIAAGHPDVGVFLIGINDPGTPMIAKGDYTSYPKKSWLEEYQRRAEKLMLIMLREGAQRVYWVGLPVMPDQGQTNQVKRLNELFKGAAARHPEVVYVDTYDLLATKKGGFIAALRSGDGVHFTDEGAWRIADAVWAATKRDWLPAE
ncbi:MAG: GDSL-type esterase/lipase family protein [Actinobacteria bacterium]|nr:GDSL-type esterase/lipase family protein [Actinomycetota bacterium]